MLGLTYLLYKIWVLTEITKTFHTRWPLNSQTVWWDMCWFHMTNRGFDHLNHVAVVKTHFIGYCGNLQWNLSLHCQYSRPTKKVSWGLHCDHSMIYGFNKFAYGTGCFVAVTCCKNILCITPQWFVSSNHLMQWGCQVSIWTELFSSVIFIYW